MYRQTQQIHTIKIPGKIGGEVNVGICGWYKGMVMVSIDGLPKEDALKLCRTMNRGVGLPFNFFTVQDTNLGWAVFVKESYGN